MASPLPYVTNPQFDIEGSSQIYTIPLCISQLHPNPKSLADIIETRDKSTNAPSQKPKQFIHSLIILAFLILTDPNTGESTRNNPLQHVKMAERPWKYFDSNELVLPTEARGFTHKTEFSVADVQRKYGEICADLNKLLTFVSIECILDLTTLLPKFIIFNMIIGDESFKLEEKEENESISVISKRRDVTKNSNRITQSNNENSSHGCVRESSQSIRRRAKGFKIHLKR